MDVPKVKPAAKESGEKTKKGDKEKGKKSWFCCCCGGAKDKAKKRDSGETSGEEGLMNDPSFGNEPYEGQRENTTADNEHEEGYSTGRNSNRNNSKDDGQNVDENNLGI